MVDPALNEALKNYHPDSLEQAEICLKYSGYIKRERDTVQKLERLENIKLAKNFNYEALLSLSNEGKEKLKKIKPASLGQASRISGVSPSDISVLMVFFRKVMRNQKLIVNTIIALFFLLGCAKVISPSGGPKDDIAPEIASSSPENYTTNFKANNIELNFNEYININNTQNIFISPFQKSPPTYKLKGKKLIIEFNEPIQEESTYSIDFGDNIVDYTEGNPISNFRYVFSTADEIDSLSLKGKVQNAKDAEPTIEAIVGLYDVINDSVVKTNPPRYVARTNKSGVFKFENLKGGSYQIFALKDQNSNFYMISRMKELLS